MVLRGAGVLLTLLFLAQPSELQLLSKRKIVTKAVQKDSAVDELKRQVEDIVKELNLLKEQQALQTVCLRGTKVQGKCYLSDPVKKRYHVASEDCIAKGGTLSTPVTLNENDKLYDYVQLSLGPDEEIWLGINDMQTEGLWLDQTGSSVRYKNWHSSFKGDTMMNCAVLAGSLHGKWVDENCREERASVCEFNIV